MTNRHDRISLVDMMVYAEEAIQVLGDKSRDALNADRMMQLALQRLVEIVGEAARRTSPDTQQRHPEIPWPQIVGMRNQVVYGFDAIDLNIMWDAIKNDLPPLVEQLEAIVGRDPGRPVPGDRP